MGPAAGCGMIREATRTVSAANPTPIARVIAGQRFARPGVKTSWWLISPQAPLRTMTPNSPREGSPPYSSATRLRIARTATPTQSAEYLVPPVVSV